MEEKETVEIIEDIHVKKELPTIITRGIKVFPGEISRLNLGRIRSVKAYKQINEENPMMFLAVQKDPKIDEPKREDIYDIGVTAVVAEVLNETEEKAAFLATALKRARIIDIKKGEYYTSIVSELVEDDEDTPERDVIFEKCKEMLNEFKEDLEEMSVPNFSKILDVTSYNEFCNAIGFNLIKDHNVAALLLQETDTTNRLTMALDFLCRMKEEIRITADVMDKIRQYSTKAHKEFFLREQMKAISDELNDENNEIAVYKKKLEEIKLDEKSHAKVLKEIERLEKSSPQSPDYSILTNYLDWVFDLPYNKMSEDNQDINDVEKIFNSEHYGLEQVKKRILEYLAVYKYTGGKKAPILCLVGPPGVGKTSVAIGIAKALGKELIRMSLGGVKDESEIRGHRRTYIGSMPGRIIYNMKRAGTINPVFVLDEIDKMTSDFRGDPESALLEVLDPEQNYAFRDNFLEIPYDLSKVMFIATANSLSTISQPLLDRMEVIEIDSYTDYEKLHIAKEHLIKKALIENGLEDKNVTFSNEAIKNIIDYYTSEAGVRELYRQITGVLRKLVKSYLEKNQEFDKPVKISAKMVEKFLGVKKYRKDFLYKEDSVGEAIGLAWTSVGGTVLPIESTLMPGTGEIVLTGQLGDVMKESCKIAIDYIKSKSKDYGIKEEIFTKHDIHIHAPEGAVPKDGPSAGITLATSVLSTLLNKKIDHSYSMTGEITLRGRVLPIGGLKEKSLASYKNGITNIIIPKDNEKDIEEIPSSVRKELNFIPVSFVNEVFDHVIEK